MDTARESLKPEWVDPDDAPELTEEWFANASMYIGGKLVRRGRPPLPPEEQKRQVTLRLPPEVVEHFRAGGRGWQTRLVEVLRRHVAQAKDAA
jgi:uncharacterized protein (DUF4415 family)